MLSNLKWFYIGMVTVLLFASLEPIHSKDIDRTKKKNVNLQRTFAQNDLQQNTVSSVQFYTTNFGIFGLNIARNTGGGFWPRNSGNQYIFGGGVWFAALKKLPVKDSIGQVLKDQFGNDSTFFRKMSVISYNPNSGSSWMVPGRIEDGDSVKEDPESIKKYRTYISTDFSESDGKPRVASDGPNWPIWDSHPKEDTLAWKSYDKTNSRYFGEYIYDVNRRHVDSMPLLDDKTHKGPAIVSGEDIFTVYKDTDLRPYEDGADVARNNGYPLRTQYEQTIYTWGIGDYANFIFIAYNIINKSKDTLMECWMAPAYDFDIGISSSPLANNDRVNFYNQDTTLGLAFQWTQSGSNNNEKDRNFGYLGMDFLESPAVDLNNYIRKDKRYFTSKEQIGMRTFRNWIIQNDPTTDIARYNFMAAGVREGDNAAGDKRFLAATGPFNMRPGDTARVVVGIIFAPAVNKDATGDSTDLVELIRVDKFAQRVYDNGFATPKPPDVGPINWKPLNNAVIVTWDSTSELSIDREEKGLDFLGYRLYRAKINSLDTFNIENRIGDSKYPKGRGPLGWKQIAQWECPPPFQSSGVVVDTNDVNSPTFSNAIFVFGSDKTIKGGKQDYSRFYPGFVTPTLPNDDSSYLIRRVENRISTNGNPVAPWFDFWSKYRPASLPYTPQHVWDTLTLGIIRIKPGGIPPTKVNADSSIAQIQSSIQHLFKQVRSGKATLTWFKDEFDELLVVRRAIIKYMDSITNHRTFIDFGDDNGDGVITEDQNLVVTEKLINNVDYFYMLKAYDQGDVFQKTPAKLNSGVEKLNIAQAFPLGTGSQIISNVSNPEYDSSIIGGLYNFRLNVKDQDRFTKLLGGHQIDLIFKPSMNATLAYPNLDTLYYGSSIPTQPLKGIYQTELLVKDVTANEILGSYIVNYESRDCSFRNLPSEMSLVWMSPDQDQYEKLTDTNTTDWKSITGNFAHPLNNSIANFSGSYTTDKTCNLTQRTLKAGSFSVGFDFTLQQFGGIFRPLKSKIIKGSANVGLYRDTTVDKVMLTRINFDPNVVNPIETYNQGPGVYQIEFLAGGIEDITTSFGTTNPKTKTFKVPYLNFKIQNVYSYNRVGNNVNDSVVVSYGKEVTHQLQNLPVTIYSRSNTNTLDSTKIEYPDARKVSIGQYNLSAYGWVNGRTGDGNTTRNQQATANNSGSPIGTQGRYYLSTIDGNDTLDFCHIMLIDGVTFCFDFSGKGGRKGGFGGRLFDKEKVVPQPTTDFKVGDVVEVSTFGGCFGLPREGAKVTFKVSESKVEANSITDDLLDQIQVVPNPYIISHYGQRSGYDAKLYFTKLPKECTIKIYTVAGDLIRTITHLDIDGTYQQGMDVWDLLSDNKQRAASQGLIAIIETPNGAKTIKKFSIVVGSSQIFR